MKLGLCCSSKYPFRGFRCKSVSSRHLSSADNLCKSFGPRSTLENHCTRTVQSSCGGCSRRVHKIVNLAVQKGNICDLFYFCKYSPVIIITIIITISDYHSTHKYFVKQIHSTAGFINHTNLR